jgi:hypothetical protein
VPSSRHHDLRNRRYVPYYFVQHVRPDGYRG